MKSFALAAFLFLTVAAGAGSLDYSRYTLVITVPGTEAPGIATSGRVLERARRALRAATFDRDYTVDDFLSIHGRQARQMERLRLESRHGDVRFTSDGGSETDYEFPVTGAIMELLMPVPGPKRLLGRVACPCCGREWPADRPAPDDQELVPYEDGTDPGHTGLLIDVRGLDFRPALFPAIITTADAEIYGPAFADPEALIAKGIAGYYLTKNQAILDRRVGSNPMVVRALSVAGRNRSDVVIADHDAARIHGSKRNIDNLNRCRVGLLTD